MINSCLFEATVYHKRHQPTLYAFSHKVLYLNVNLNDLGYVKKKRLFSIDAFNLFSLYWKEYGFNLFKDPKEYILEKIGKCNLKTEEITSVSLMTMPKMLGYGFNPISFWFFFNAKGKLQAVLAEVNNTFGERHAYLCFNKDNQPIEKSDVLCHRKVFHVSPFFSVSGEYRFQFELNEKTIKINIDYDKEGERMLSTCLYGRSVVFSDKNLIKYFFTIPFSSIKVIFLIHYHALILWMKKNPYIKKTVKPDFEISKME